MCACDAMPCGAVRCDTMRCVAWHALAHAHARACVIVCMRGVVWHGMVRGGMPWRAVPCRAVPCMYVCTSAFVCASDLPRPQALCKFSAVSHWLPGSDGSAVLACGAAEELAAASSFLGFALANSGTLCDTGGPACAHACVLVHVHALPAACLLA